MRIKLSDLMNAVNEDDNAGFCISCGAEHYGVEPDARGYDCEECELPSVYGAMEIILMGYF